MVESMRTTIPVVVMMRSLDRRCRSVRKVNGVSAGGWPRRRRSE